MHSVLPQVQYRPVLQTRTLWSPPNQNSLKNVDLSYVQVGKSIIRVWSSASLHRPSLIEQRCQILQTTPHSPTLLVVHSSSNFGVFTLHLECVRLWKGEERTGFSRVPTHSSLSNDRAVKLGFFPYPPFSFDRPCGERACLFLLARKCQLHALKNYIQRLRNFEGDT
jgi:hypothetical protein